MNHISEYVFHFKKSSDGLRDALSLNLYNNNLNSLSFQIGSFSGFIKPTEVEFCAGPNDKNNITYLDEKVFEPFLNVSYELQQVNSIKFVNTLDWNDS